MSLKVPTTRGKLIIVDGADGSGKTVQAKLLIQTFHSLGIKTKYMDFPQYNTFYGKIVAQFLRGEFGSIDNVSPYLASLPFAMDRLGVKDEIETYLKNGVYVISNRYATSNMAHQGAKFKTEQEKIEYIQWAEELEYVTNGIPREDIVLYLHVPFQITQKLMENRQKKEYLEDKTSDIHEKDGEYLQKVEKMYLSLAQKNNHWVTIESTRDGEMLSVERIHEEVKKALINKGALDILN